jgi:hypothetical protein
VGLAAELAPGGDKVVMAVKDQTAFATGHSMFSCEALVYSTVYTYGIGCTDQYLGPLVHAWTCTLPWELPMQ